MVVQDGLRKALAPVMDKDALSVTDGNNSYPLCATAPGAGYKGLALGLEVIILSNTILSMTQGREQCNVGKWGSS